MCFRSHHPSRRSRTSMAMIAQRCDPTSFVNLGSIFTMAIWVETHPFGFGCKWTITLTNQNQQQMIFLVNYYSLILRLLHIFFEVIWNLHGSTSDIWIIWWRCGYSMTYMMTLCWWFSMIMMENPTPVSFHKFLDVLWYWHAWNIYKHITWSQIQRARPRGPRGSMKYQFVYLEVRIFQSGCHRSTESTARKQNCRWMETTSGIESKSINEIT